MRLAPVTVSSPPCSLRSRSAGIRPKRSASELLLALPPLLALFGRKLFWPFVPKPGAEQITDTGAWHRVADWVSRHATRVAVASIAVLAVLATGLLATPVGLNQIDQFQGLIFQWIDQRIRLQQTKLQAQLASLKENGAKVEQRVVQPPP